MSNNKALMISLIVPCYNEKIIVEQNIETIQEILETTKYSYEIILYDDGSTDGTREIGSKIADKSPHIRWEVHNRNCGRGKTVTDGLRLAKGDIVGFIDIDLEVSAINIIPLVIAIEKGNDVAVGVRLEHSAFNEMPLYKYPYAIGFWLLRYILSTGYSILVKWLLGINLKDTEIGFKFFKKEKVMPLLDEIEENGWFWDTEIMVRSYYKGFNIFEYPVLFIKNQKKKSTVKIHKDVPEYFFKLLRFKKFVLPRLKNNGKVHN